MTRRIEPWIAVACLVAVASPLVQVIARGTGFTVAAVLSALTMGAIVLALYVRSLTRARRQLDS